MATRTGRLLFATGEDGVSAEKDVSVEESSLNKEYRSWDSAHGIPRSWQQDSAQGDNRWQQESSAGIGVGMGTDMDAGMRTRSKSSITFPTCGGNGTFGAAGSAQQEVADVEEMKRSKSDYAFQRCKSKREIKTEKTTKFYRDLTDALHTKVADFMVGVSTEHDEDELDELKRDLTSTIKALQEALMSEVQQRERSERIMQEQFERQQARFDELRVTQDRLIEIQNVVGKANERVQYLENSIGSNVKKLSQDVEALKSGNLVADMERLNNANQIQAAKIQELERHCNGLVDHIHHIMNGHGQLENKLEATFRNYSDELDSKHDHHATKHKEHTENLDKVQCDLSRIHAEAEYRHSDLVKTLEESINEALSKTHAMIVTANKEGADTAKDLAALRSEVDEQHQKAVDGYAPQIDEVRMNLNSLQQAALDNFGNNMRELDGSMKQRVGKLDKRCNDMSELIDREAQAGERFRTAAQDCFDRMDEQFTTMNEACNGHARDLRTLTESSAGMGTGLDQLKNSMDKLASNTASEVHAIRDEIDQICNSLCNMSKSWSSNIWSRRPERSMTSSESHTMEIRTGGA